MNMTNYRLIAVSTFTGAIGVLLGLLLGGAYDQTKDLSQQALTSVVEANFELPSKKLDCPDNVPEQVRMARAAKNVHASNTLVEVTPLESTALAWLESEAQHESPNRYALLEPMRALFSELQAYDSRTAENLASLDDADALRLEDELRRLMHTSPIHLNYAIDQVRDMASGAQKDLLLSLIIESNSPESEDFARELITSDEPAQVIMGLEIIRDLGRNGAVLRADLLHVLQNSADAEVIRTAIDALTPTMIAPSEQANILSALATYAGHQDSTVRASALEKSVRLSARGSGVKILLTGLTDTSPVVRSAAAFAASHSGIKSDGLRDQLLQVLDDTDEDWSVRHHAFNALSTYRDLLDEEYDSFKRFEAELTLVSEGHSG